MCRTHTEGRYHVSQFPVAAHLPVLFEVPARRLGVAARARTATMVATAVVITALCAQVSFVLPGSPVPLTGQTFAVLVTGAALGPLRGATAQGLYLLIGLVGVPVFADGTGGVSVVFGATGGYLLAFVAAAALMGWGARRGADRHIASTLALYGAATVLIYTLGASWLFAWTGMSFTHAIAVGVVPFIIGDVVKAALAAGLLPTAWKVVDRMGGRG